MVSLVLVLLVWAVTTSESSGAHLMAPVAGEPSCEELRVMWRFSRRQSRVAEATNEIPTYRDPFAYNVWEEFPRPRSMTGTVRSVGRSWSRPVPVYGRMVQNAPRNHPRLGNIETAQAYEEVLRYLGNTNGEPRYKTPGSAFRLTGGLPRPSPLSQMGSFQHLKQLIWAERAKELQEQRMLEEAAARTVALKDIKLPAHMRRGYVKQLYDARYGGADGQLSYYEDGARPNRLFPASAQRKTYHYNPIVEEGEDGVEGGGGAGGGGGGGAGAGAGAGFGARW